MGCIDFVLLAIVAGISGALGGAIGGSSRGGCVVSIALGFVGALVGLTIARFFQWPDILSFEIGSVRFPFAWAVIGSAFFVAVLGLFRRRR